MWFGRGGSCAHVLAMSRVRDIVELGQLVRDDRAGDGAAVVLHRTGNATLSRCDVSSTQARSVAWSSWSGHRSQCFDRLTE